MILSMSGGLEQQTIAFLPPPVVGGTLAGQVWGVLTGGPYDNAGVRRAAVQAAAARAAATAVSQWIRRDGTSDLALAALIDPSRLGQYGPDCVFHIIFPFRSHIARVHRWIHR